MGVKRDFGHQGDKQETGWPEAEIFERNCPRTPFHFWHQYARDPLNEGTEIARSFDSARDPLKTRVGGAGGRIPQNASVKLLISSIRLHPIILITV